MPLHLAAQPGYWQQRVHYTMQVALDVETHRYTGMQSLIYTNHSPDTLDRVFYHLYANAFQPGSQMDVWNNQLPDPDDPPGDRIAGLSPDEIGFLHVQELTQDGLALSFEEEGTILEVRLDHVLLPGASTVLDLRFEGQVPLQCRRSGRDNAEGIDYTMTQWYPKLCEYDREGWHAHPYIGREFHGVWGDFDVTIVLDSAYTVAGTGYLQNPQQIGHGYETPGQPVVRPQGQQLAWHFYAPQVHDFAWAADPDYLHDRLAMDEGPVLHFFYQPDVADNWKTLQSYTARTFDLMREQYGAYPYEQYSVIQGGDGGMEYAMCTMITGDRGAGSLLSVTVHELIHSWFQHVLGTNESLYAWMDEGFTSFAQDRILDQLYGNYLLNPQYSAYLDYLDLVAAGKQEPLTTHADHFQTNQAYWTSSYNKGAIALHQLSYVIGQQAFDRGMKRYFSEWQFRHPTTTDFKRVMEKTAGLELDWYFEYWINSTHTIDYGVAAAAAQQGQTRITLTRTGAMPMPVDVFVKYKDGAATLYHVPLDLMRGVKGSDVYGVPVRYMEDWPWTQRSYTFVLPRDLGEIEYIEIDPTFRLADVNRFDNRFPKDKKYRPVWESYGAVPMLQR
ncbi:MAG: M1 family metallopeptidase [Bacteroidia bacterium]